jgi:hypothetical protein
MTPAASESGVDEVSGGCVSSADGDDRARLLGVGFEGSVRTRMA